VADERPAALSSTTGTWRVGTKHKARVIGHSPMDGVILLSFEKRVLEQRFMLVSEIKVGEVMKVRVARELSARDFLLTNHLQGTINRFTDKAIFINVSGSVDGVVWPLHYADIQLKHPEKRFKAGNTVKCRVSRLLISFRVEKLTSTIRIGLRYRTGEEPSKADAEEITRRLEIRNSGIFRRIQIRHGCFRCG
jgi:transcriptional accessory protein Tex/SPT6